MNARLRTLWQELTNSSPRITDPEDQRRSRLLSSMILLLPLLALTLLVLSALFYPLPGFDGPRAGIVLAVVVGSVPVFVLNYRGYYRIAVVLVLVLVSGAIIIAAIIDGMVLFSLLNLVIPILIAAMFLSLPWALALLAIFTLGLTQVPEILGHFVTMSLLLLFFHQGWQMLEYWRQQQLVESEERYRHVTELMSDFAYKVRVLPDNHLEIEWITGAFEQITGYTNEQITVEKWEQIIHPDDRVSVFAQHDGMLASGRHHVREFRIITAAGEVRWLREDIQPQWDQRQGRIVSAYGAMRDITTAKQAQAAEHDQRVLAEALRDTAAAVNSTLAFDEVLDRIIANVGRVVRYDTCTIMLIENGIARAVRHKGFEKFAPEQIVTEHLFIVDEVRSLREIWTTGQPVLIPNTYAYEGWVRVPVSDWIASFLGVPIKQDGLVIGFLNVDSRETNGFTRRDADNLKAFADQVSIALRNAQIFEALSQEAVELEQRVVARTVELDREKRQLRTLLDSMGEGMVYTEGQTICFANSAITALTGFTPDELVGRSLDEFTVSTEDMPETTLYDAINLAVKDAPVWRGDVRLRNRAGTEFDIGLTISRVSDASDPELQTVTVLRDVATEKALQAQRGRFVAITSHELRTPITNILTRLYLLQRQPDKQDEHVAILESVAQRMKRLVEDLLDLPQLEQGLIRISPQPAVLQDLVAEVVAVQAAEAARKSITLDVVQPDTLLRASVDADRMIQVVTNLLINAISYTPPEGRVTIQLDHDDADVRILVTDNGPGIPPEHIDDVFEPFFRVPERRRDSTGTGLGLSIVREIVNLHGGSIMVVSDGENGTSFIIRLRALE